MRRALVCAAMLVSGCGFGNKTNIMFECQSPSGKLVATFYRVSSGDRPGDQALSVNIRPFHSRFKSGMHSFSFRHGYDAIIHWDSDQAMRIEYPRGSEILHQERVVFGSSQTFDANHGIHIDYQEKISTHGYFLVEKRCFNT
ncbi:MAG: hypothetical protein Q9M82_04405 [Mariprofundus sp.]|nr:hypothetical protein [Mariprofundus sp.]